MCLAIPMLLVAMDGPTGKVELDGIRREVMLDLVPEAKIGDYVIVHAGYAIQTLDEQAARETLSLLAELAGTES
jgi:hydrogenase expression/formation protein HypC